MCANVKSMTTNGNVKLAGKLASTWMTGCTNLARRSFMPMSTPTGTQMTEHTTVSTTTRAKVMRPSTRAWPISPNPAPSATAMPICTTPNATMAATMTPHATSPARRREPVASNTAPVTPSTRIARSSTSPTGVRTRPSTSEMCDRRRSVSTALLFSSTESLCVMRNFSAQAVRGFQSRKSMASTTMAMTTMAAPILPSS